MLPLMLAAALAFQPAVVENATPRSSLTEQATQLDVGASMATLGQTQAAYRALAAQARQSGDAPLANALTAKAAYAAIIQGHDTAARIALIAVLKDGASAPATREFATSLLAYINQPNRELGYGPYNTVGNGVFGFAHGVNGVIQHF